MPSLPIVDIRYYFENLLTYLQRYAPLNRDDFKKLVPFLEVRNFEKKTAILPIGIVENYVNVVMRGMVRKSIRTKGNDLTLQLATEGHLIHSEISFHQRIPSEMIIETVEPSIVISISYENMQTVLEEFAWAERLAGAIIAAMYIQKDARAMLQLTQGTKERFIEYVTNNPQMLQRVPQKILASYLNIKPETYSRLKHLLRGRS